MIAIINRKGFTLLELLAVFAIIFIILTFTLPKVLATINNSKTEADIANLDSLNRATDQYKFFLELDNRSLPDGLTQKILLEKGYINDILEPLDSDKEFVWGSLSKSWNYAIKDSEDDTSTSEGYSLTDEETNLFSVDDGVLKSNNEERLVITDNWVSDQEGAISIPEGETVGAFSVQHNLGDSYTILVDTKLDGDGILSNITYSTYFESALQNKLPVSGYAFEVSFAKVTGNTFRPIYTLKNLETNMVLASIDNINNILYEFMLIKIDVVNDDRIEIALFESDNNNQPILDQPIIYSVDPIQDGQEETYSGVKIVKDSQNANTIFYDLQITPYE